MPQEVNRLLNKNGYFLYHTISASDPAAKELIRLHPCPEQNTYIIPQTGMVEHVFSKHDFSFLFPSLKMVHFEEEKQNTQALDKVYERVYCLGLLQKQ